MGSYWVALGMREEKIGKETVVIVVLEVMGVVARAWEIYMAAFGCDTI